MYRLVIIDDERKIAEGIGSLFPWNNVGFEVADIFTSCIDALSYIKNNNIQVVLSDVQMPDMDGIALCRELADTDIRVVLFSSHQNYEYFRDAIRYKAVDYLLKPVNYSDLMSCFERLCAVLDKENQQKAEEHPQGYWEQIINNVLEYINEHCRDATLERAAERVYLSPAYLSRNFKEKSGEGFSEAALRNRMEKAKSLLADIQYRSYDVAYFVGYDNPKNFGRAFKAYYGITPMEYRKSILGGEVKE